MGVGVLADVHRRQMRAERDQRADRALEPAPRDELAAVGQQRVAHDDEIGEQLVGAEVGAPRLVRPAVEQAAAGVEQLLADARQLEPVGLLGVQAPVALVELPEVLQVGGQRRLELRRGAGDPHGGGQVAAQLVDDVQRVPDGMVVLEREDVEGRLRGDVRIAVPVAADPRAERERTGVERQLDPDPRQLLAERLQRVRDGVAVQRVEVVHGAAGLVDHVGTREAELVGLPQQVDQLAEPAADAAPGDRVAVAARAVPLVEEPRDLPHLREHGAARGLGRVRGEDRPQPEVPDVVGELGPGVPAGGDAIDGLRQPGSVADPDRRAARDPGAPARPRWPGRSTS